jgi:hypothetical protein
MSNDWKILQGPVETPSDRDSMLFRVRYERDGAERDAFVYVSGTAMASDTRALPLPVATAVATRGLSLVEESLSKGKSPKVITADSSGGVWEESYD